MSLNNSPMDHQIKSPSTSEGESCRYFVSAGPSLVVVHVLGASSYLNCRAFGRFLEIQQKGRAFKRRLCLNLASCVSLDSTVAGLIAKSAYDGEEEHRWGRVGIVRASARVRVVLLNLGLGPVLDFLDEAPEGAGLGMESISRYVDISGACPPEEIFLAHEALVALDESNVERFSAVFEALHDDPGLAPVASEPAPAFAPPPMPEERKRIRFDVGAALGRAQEP